VLTRTTSIAEPSLEDIVTAEREAAIGAASAAGVKLASEAARAKPRMILLRLIDLAPCC
jgi:hypothetical protein